MKHYKRILAVLFLAVLLISALCVPALALTESEVEAEVAASSKESVTGNVLIWFLCAVAFLKVSQKVDSFMATLGVNVGRTGGSMLAEAMIAMRAVTMVVGGKQGGGAGRSGTSPGGTAGKSGASGMMGFFKGGLVGMAGRHITNSAVKTATTQTSAVHTAQSKVRQTAATAAAVAQTVPLSSSAPNTNVNSATHVGGSSIHTKQSAPTPEGVIATGGPPAPVPPVGNMPPAPSMPSNMPPQEGVILAGGEAAAPTPPAEHTPPVTPVSDGMPPPEGVILTGNEAPVPNPPPNPVPPETAPTDVPLPQENVIITEGDPTVHAPQTGGGFPPNPVPSPSPTGAPGVNSDQHTQVHTERAQTSHTSTSGERVHSSRFHTSGTGRPSLGGMVFSHSLQSGGAFANEVIGTVARGEVAGSITGDMAAQSLVSYMGYAPTGIAGSREPPTYSDVEIDRGRITGVETAAGMTEGRSFAMYHVDQYTAPSGDYTKIVAADGTQWYKQYAQDAVERKPYMAPDDTVAYNERIVKKLPDPPKRKDRI